MPTSSQPASPQSVNDSNRYSAGGDAERLRAQAEQARAEIVALLRAHGLQDGMRVLDLGCGLGLVAEAIASAHPQASVHGIDCDAQAIAQAAALALPGRLSFACGDACALEEPDGRYDFVVVSLVLMHLAEPAAALAEAIRVLRPGGRLCVLDTDDAFFLVDPPSEAFERLKERLSAWYASFGGSRTLGRRLPGLLTAAGLEGVRFGARVLDSLAMGQQTFDRTYLGIFRAQAGRIVEAGLLSAGEAEALLTALDDYAAGAFFGTIAGLVGSGRKPD